MFMESVLKEREKLRGPQCVERGCHRRGGAVFSVIYNMQQWNTDTVYTSLPRPSLTALYSQFRLVEK